MTTVPIDMPTGASAAGYQEEIARSSPRAIARSMLIGFCVLSALVGRLSYLAQPFDDDGAMFVYLGRVVTEGGRFCHDVVDNKFPTVGMMTSHAYRAFGAWWGGYVCLQTAMGIGAALLLARLAARNFGESARLPALLFALVHFNLYVAVYGGFQLETMQCFFAILAAGAAMEAIGGRGDWRDAFVVGLAAGCAAMLKPTGASVLVAFAFATIVSSYRSPTRILGHGLAAACGLAIPAATVLAYLIGTNVLHDMPGLYRQISRYAAETPFEWIDLLKPLTVAIIIGFPLFVSGWIGRRDCTGMKPAPSLVIFVLVWLAIEFLGALAQRRMYPYHFLPLAPPAALLFAAIPRQERLSRLAAAIAPAAVASIVFGLLLVARMDGRPARMAASDYLAAHASAGDRVWQDWYCRTLLETGLQPGSRVPLTFLFMNYDSAPQEYAGMILADLERLKPKYVFLATDLGARIEHFTTGAPELSMNPVRAENYRRAYREIEAYVKSHYVAEAQVSRETAYRLRASKNP